MNELSLTRLYKLSFIEIIFSPQTQTLTASQFSSDISAVSVRVTYFVDSHLFEGDLQELEVLDVFVLQLGTKFHFLQRHRVDKQHVHELTVGSACTDENKHQQEARAGRG